MFEKLRESPRTQTRRQETPQEGDLDLVRRAKRGERASVDAFVARMGCVPRMLTRQNARLGAPLTSDEVEDLVQDVLVVIWRKVELFEGRSTLETWVYRVCRLELMNGIRRKRRFLESVEEAEHDPMVESDAIPGGGEAEGALRELERLGPPAADIIRMKHFEQLTFEAIGARLSISPNTAKTQYYRGLCRLRSLLDSRGSEDAR